MYHIQIKQPIGNECPVLTGAIFATQEVINQYLQEGSKVYMCLYNLQKAIDSVEFPVLLKRLFDMGVNSKTWRILRSWYTNCQSSVHLRQHVSPSFPLGCGVIEARFHSFTSPVPARHGSLTKTTSVPVCRDLG